MTVSLWDIGKPVYKKEMDVLDEEDYRHVQHVRRLLVCRFKELYYSSSPPRHPYKVMMQIRKELGIPADKKHRFPHTVKALELLKEEFEEDWQSRVNN